MSSAGSATVLASAGGVLRKNKLTRVAQTTVWAMELVVVCNAIYCTYVTLDTSSSSVSLSLLCDRTRNVHNIVENKSQQRAQEEGTRD